MPFGRELPSGEKSGIFFPQKRVPRFFHGGYGVMAAQQVVVLLARVRSSLVTPQESDFVQGRIFVCLGDFLYFG